MQKVWESSIWSQGVTLGQQKEEKTVLNLKQHSLCEIQSFSLREIHMVI